MIAIIKVVICYYFKPKFRKFVKSVIWLNILVLRMSIVFCGDSSGCQIHSPISKLINSQTECLKSEIGDDVKGFWKAI